jgi:hypothetical protein
VARGRRGFFGRPVRRPTLIRYKFRDPAAIHQLCSLVDRQLTNKLAAMTYAKAPDRSE